MGVHPQVTSWQGLTVMTLTLLLKKVTFVLQGLRYFYKIKLSIISRLLRFRWIWHLKLAIWQWSPTFQIFLVKKREEWNESFVDFFWFVSLSVVLNSASLHEFDLIKYAKHKSLVLLCSSHIHRLSINFSCHILLEVSGNCGPWSDLLIFAPVCLVGKSCLAFILNLMYLSNEILR